jgi:Arc/MetJ-type ribon-helix-helix transcriptional regulator
MRNKFKKRMLAATAFVALVSGWFGFEAVCGVKAAGVYFPYARGSGGVLEELWGRFSSASDIVRAVLKDLHSSETVGMFVLKHDLEPIRIELAHIGKQLTEFIADNPKFKDAVRMKKRVDEVMNETRGAMAIASFAPTYSVAMKTIKDVDRYSLKLYNLQSRTAECLKQFLEEIGSMEVALKQSKQKMPQHERDEKGITGCWNDRILFEREINQLNDSLDHANYILCYGQKRVEKRLAVVEEEHLEALLEDIRSGRGTLDWLAQQILLDKGDDEAVAGYWAERTAFRHEISRLRGSLHDAKHITDTKRREIGLEVVCLERFPSMSFGAVPPTPPVGSVARSTPNGSSGVYVVVEFGTVG